MGNPYSQYPPQPELTTEQIIEHLQNTLIIYLAQMLVYLVLEKIGSMLKYVLRFNNYKNMNKNMNKKNYNDNNILINKYNNK
jgi:hypothetical protein